MSLQQDVKSRTLKYAVGESLVGWAFILNMIEKAVIGLLCCNTALLYSGLQKILHTLFSRLTAGHGAADCPKLTVLFKCTLRVSPQQWPEPGAVLSEPLFVFSYHCQMYAFKPGNCTSGSPSDHHPVSTRAVISLWERQFIHSCIVGR